MQVRGKRGTELEQGSHAPGADQMDLGSAGDVQLTKPTSRYGLGKEFACR
jgi:hypothetical protein